MGDVPRRSNNGSGGGSSSSLREKKRSRIRQHLNQMSSDEFRRRCASHLRAIRYLRLRNQEVAMVNCIVRLRRVLNDQLRWQQQQQQQQPHRRRRQCITTARSGRRIGNGGHNNNDDNKREDVVVVVVGRDKNATKDDEKRPRPSKK